MKAFLFDYDGGLKYLNSFSGHQIADISNASFRKCFRSLFHHYCLVWDFNYVPVLRKDSPKDDNDDDDDKVKHRLPLHLQV